ncbi:MULTISPECIES: DUF4124 domain-containing protein [Pseudomonas]|uniref:DUF4124 domain-containing protein n=1 Tax=Pseudomonas TaxID=286 RepID=UPI001CFB5CCB|nr:MULTISPECIES: DUF4124 domain-containing protein [Pseudomonas]
MRAMIIKVSLLLLLSTSAFAGQIYKWVDAQGVTHFDAQPPAGQNSTPIETRTPPAPAPATAPKGSAPTGTDDKQKAADAKVKQEVTDAQQRTDEFCDQARTNLAQLTNNPRVRQDVDGELRRLTEEERQAKITETKASIADTCQ